MKRYVRNWLAMAITPIWVLSACGDDAGSGGAPDASVDAQAPDAIPGPGRDPDAGPDNALVLSAAALSVDEGATATFTVALAQAPDAGVTVTIASSDAEAASIDTTSLSLDGDAATQAVTITVTGVDDADANNETVTLTLSAPGLADATVAVTVLDDEAVNIQLDPTSVELSEGGTATFGIRLTAAPDGDFTVTVASSDDTAVTAAPASITFGADDFDVAQTVTLTGVNDADADSERVTITVSDGDDGNGIEDRSLGFAVADNDQRINATPSPLRLTPGASGAVSVTMAGQPAADVTISVASGNESAATVDEDTLVFTSANYDVPQTLTVTAGSNAGNTAITLSSADLPNASVIVIISL